MGVDRAPYAGGQAFGSAARDRATGRVGCDLVYRANRLSVAHAAKGLSSVYHRARLFYDWRDDGLFEKINFALPPEAREAAGREPSPSAGVIDSQSVKTTESGGPRGYDAAKKVKGRKRHIVTDTTGLLLGGEVHPADVQDRDGAGLVIEAIHQLFPRLRHLFADSVYNGPNLRDALAKFGNWTIEIVKRAADAAGFQLLPRRWVVERTFAWLNRNRRLAKDFEASIASAKAWVYITSVQLLIRRLACSKLNLND